VCDEDETDDEDDDEVEDAEDGDVYCGAIPVKSLMLEATVRLRSAYSRTSELVMAGVADTRLDGPGEIVGILECDILSG